MGLEIFVHCAAVHCFVEIYQMSVEIGTVNTCEFSLAANSQTATATHTGTIDHDGVHGNGGLDIVLLGQLRNKLHHYQRADSDNFVVLVAFLDQSLQCIGNQTLEPLVLVT